MERLKRKEKCQLTEKFLQFGEGNFCADLLIG